ncbi:helix-turn-helix domain-containing protein [Natronorarus salvus]|uniref:helix-turn-helix domain-containing protein n=1 Tax=Natronorarus salvus TaxID=3117733 RepID=UPI002F2645D1
MNPERSAHSIPLELQVPGSDTLFESAVERVPSLEMELEQVALSDGVSIRCGGASRREVEDALEATRGVVGYDLVSEHEGECLYSLTFEDDAFRVMPSIVESGGTILSAYLSGGTWSLRLRYVEREEIERTIELLRANDVDASITTIRTISTDDVTEIGLTTEQYEALSLAVERGYFEVPRRISLQELAEELDVSHQSLSERLRRAQRVLSTDFFESSPSGETTS